MSVPKQGRTWVLANKPTGDVRLSGADATFKLETKDLPELKENQILVKVTYLSNDPAQRGWIDANVDPKRLYVPPVQQGATMNSRGLAEVIESKSQKFKKGVTISGNFGWSEYKVLDDTTQGLAEAKDLPGGLSKTHYLGALGGNGVTAYYGLVVISEAKKGDSVLVSGAAGATGSIVVQIAKHIIGASRVVGVAGTDEKCRWVESLGADKCLNYKSKDFQKEFLAEEGFDVYFDNVAGEILDLALLKMNMYGRIAACGSVSSYNSGNGWESKNYFNIISMRLSIKGFIIFDYIHKAAEVVEIYRKAIAEGKLQLGKENETIVPTKFEDIPKTWTMLFSGGNQGKLVSQLE